MADLKAMRDADWWDDPWIPVKVDTLRALLDCAEALRAIYDEQIDYFKINNLPGCENNHVMVQSREALAALERSP